MEQISQMPSVESAKALEAKRNFNLSSFQSASQRMIATNDAAYRNSRFDFGRLSRVKDYTQEEIERIVSNGSLAEQQKLSRNYFFKDGFYKQILIYYATLLKYAGLLIPNPSYGKKLSTPNIQKRYYAAMDYIEKMDLRNLLPGLATRALIDGAYYGLIQKADKNTFSILDLPCGYACSNFRDEQGNDIVEFDLSYFNTIIDEDSRKAALRVYPTFISKAYDKYRKGKGQRVIMLPSEIGICFPLFDGRPPFLSIIPTTIKYDETVEIEQERDLEEIKKIIVQKIPHLNEGALLFEPDEAEQIHLGTVNMLRGNKNVSVLTTYADVDAIISKTASEAKNSSVEKMLQNIYSQAGVSSHIFASTGSSTLEASIKYDIAYMMQLANKFARFITKVVNDNYANGNVSFKYTILPVGFQNEEKYVDEAFKLVSSGYSCLMPVIAQGLSQRDILNVKDLENDVLKLADRLVPLSSAYTQSAKQASNKEGGRPEKNADEKADKTIENEESLDNQTGGGSN